MRKYDCWQYFKDFIHEFFIAPIIQHQQRYQEIAPYIEPLVNTLNNIADINTIASCQGHLHGRVYAPYVYFKAPLAIAKLINQHLQEQNIPREIHARFNS